jgi:glycosyltransferase involved in cell wall biosynthesis
VDLDRFNPGLLTREEARTRLDLPQDAQVLAVVAQLTPWKGQDLAVRLLARLRERFPAVRLLLVGTAKFVSEATRYDNIAYERALRELIASLGLEEQVAFLGERPDVPEILRAVDALLVPSWEEPFGRTVVEAMAMEVPVLATDIGGPAETVRDGVDGFLLPPREPERWVEPAGRLLASADMRARMGASGRVRAAERFSGDVLAGELLERYREVLAGAG